LVKNRILGRKLNKGKHGNYGYLSTKDKYYYRATAENEQEKLVIGSKENDKKKEEKQLKFWNFLELKKLTVPQRKKKNG